MDSNNNNNLSSDDDISSMSSHADVWSTLLVVVSIGAQIGIVVGGVVPYVPQFLALKRAGSTKGFSTYVCLALLVANTLRILFWFGRHYEIPLLIQSILMNLAMFALIHLCVRLNHKDSLVKGQEHIFTDFELRYFWQWTDFQSYVEFIMSLAVVGGVLMFFLADVSPFVETVGFLAVFTEALLGVPQFYRNLKNKSTYGMSLPMVLMWTCGDVFKTTYFYLRKTPLQFVICGALQVSIDLAILLQVWVYRESTLKRKKSEMQLNA